MSIGASLRRTANNFRVPRDRATQAVAGVWRRGAQWPTRRGGTGAAAVGATIVSVGGEAPQGTIGTVYGFDVVRRRWRRLPDLPTPRHGLAVAALAGRVYAIAGGTIPGLATSGANEFLPLRG